MVSNSLEHSAGKIKSADEQLKIEQTLSELESVRDILFAQERQHINDLSQKLTALNESLKAQGAVQEGALHDQAQQLLAEIEALQQTAVSHQDQAAQLQLALDQFYQEFKQENETLVPHLVDQMSGIIQATIHNSPDEMAEALGPVMGGAIRVQIRDSREEMIEALYPIIISTVQRAIAEFARELQKNIDARVKSTFSFQSFWRNTKARLTGVSPSDLQLRDALPFQVREIFIIQHETGLLLAHKSAEVDPDANKDLISGMLTAVRDFARDSFEQSSTDKQLNEIQYDEAHIAIQSGQYIYLAIVTTGVEPEWFRSQLRQFVSELHIHHAPALRDYAGDATTIDALPSMVNNFWDTITARPEEAAKRPVSRQQKWALAAGGLGLLILLAFSCFYLQFTLALLPVAFGDTPTPAQTSTATAALTATATATHMPTATHTHTPTATLPPTATPTHTPTATAASTATATATNPPQATATAMPTATPMPVTAVNVWVWSAPSTESDLVGSLLANTAVSIISQTEEWAEISWQNNLGLQKGWVQLKWIQINGGSQ